MSQNQQMHLTASINRILLTDEMTPGEKNLNIKLVEDMTTVELKEN